jgi:hypothetical protein
MAFESHSPSGFREGLLNSGIHINFIRQNLLGTNPSKTVYFLVKFQNPSHCIIHYNGEKVEAEVNGWHP